MKKSIIIILSIVGILLTAVIAFDGQNENKGLTSGELPKFNQQEIDQINLVKGDRQLAVKKVGNGWQLLPSGKAVDEAKVLRVLNGLSETTLGDLVSESAGRQEIYEISDVQGLKVTLKAGEQEKYAVIFGKRAKNGAVFLRQPGDNLVYRTAKAPLHELELNQLAWREKRLLKNNPDELKNIKAMVENESYELAKDGDSWTIRAADLGDNYRLDEQRVQALGRNLTMLKAVNFNDAPSVTLPESIAVFELDYGHNQVKRLVIGKADENRQHTVIIEGQNDIFLVTSSAVEQIALSAQRLRDLSLFRSELKEVKRVKFGGEKTVEIIRDEAGKFQLAPGYTDAEFDSNSATILVRSLLNLRAGKYLGNSGTLGMSKKQLTIELEDNSGVHILTLGDKGDDNLYLAITTDFPGTYGVGEYNVKRFTAGLEMFHRPPLSAPGGNFNYEQLQKLPPEVQQQILQKIREQQNQ